MSKKPSVHYINYSESDKILDAQHLLSGMENNLRYYLPELPKNVKNQLGFNFTDK